MQVFWPVGQALVKQTQPNGKNRPHHVFDLLRDEQLLINSDRMQASQGGGHILTTHGPHFGDLDWDQT